MPYYAASCFGTVRNNEHSHPSNYVLLALNTPKPSNNIRALSDTVLLGNLITSTLNLLVH